MGKRRGSDRLTQKYKKERKKSEIQRKKDRLRREEERISALPLIMKARF